MVLEDGRQWLNAHNVKFTASVQLLRFTKLMENYKAHGKLVGRPGDWGGIWNKDSKEIFVHNWDKEESIGKKGVLSNAYVQGRKLQSDFLIPTYAYALHCSSCDTYNRAYHVRKYPHKTGGNKRAGDCGYHHR